MRVETNETPIEEKIREYLNPEYGKRTFFAGGIGKGKTHEITNYIYHMTKDLGWHVCTNIQFKSSVKRDMPEKTHFVRYMTDFWKTFANIREQVGDVPVIFIPDEFHTTVNRLESHKYYNVVTALVNYLSQIRKHNQAFMPATQFLIQIPGDIRMYASNFIIKNETIAKQLTLNSKNLSERYFSQAIELDDGEVKVLDRHGNTKHVRAKKFRKRHISHPLEDLIKNGIVKDILGSTSSPLNDPRRGKYQFKSDKVSILQFDQIDGDEVRWFTYLLRDLGETERKGIESWEAIRDFFDKYEADDKEFKYNMKNFSKSELAAFIYEMSSMTLQESADMFDISRQAVHQTEIDEEKHYWLSKNFLKGDVEESIDRTKSSQNIVNQSTPHPHVDNKKEKEKRNLSKV